MRRIIILLSVVVVITGCTSTLPPQFSIDKDFNTTGVKSLSVKMDCDDVKIDGIDPVLVPAFCHMLHTTAISSIKRKTGYKILEGSSDIDVILKIEEISASSPFWVNMGAGRSVLTVSTEIVKGGKVIAKKRMVEINAIPNISENAWSNEEMISEYIGNLGGRISDFIAYTKDN